MDITNITNAANNLLNEMDEHLTEAETPLRREVELYAKRMGYNLDQVASKVGDVLKNYGYRAKDLEPVLDKKQPMTRDIAAGLQKAFGIHLSHWLELANK